MSGELHAKARVRVSIEIILADEWGPGCSIEQVMAQASTTALNMLDRAFVNSGAARAETGLGSGSIRLIGEPAVQVVIVSAGVET